MSSAAQVPNYDFSVLRMLRKRESLRIADVSDSSGISAAVISKLERNQTRAELDTLFKVARVFGMTAAELIAMAESPLAKVGKEDTYSSDGFQFRKIHYSNMACYYGIARSGSKIKKPEIHHDEHETCWVLKGKVRLVLPHESHDLVAGESLQFDAIQQHTYEVLEDVEMMIIHLRKNRRY